MSRLNAAPARDPLADTLINVQQVRALIGASRAFIHDAVRKGRFPAPAVRATRFTRWRLSDVNGWIADPDAWLNKAKGSQ